MQTLKRCHFILLAGFFLWAGCSATPPAAAPYRGNPDPRSWIDAPLDNSTLPMAPYTIVFHGTDPGNVAQGELAINGTVEALLPNPESDSRLAAFAWEWNPPAPGEYLLSVRTQNGQDAWSDAAEARVVVEDLPVTPTASPTPDVDTPVFGNRTEPRQVFRGVCSPNQVNFEVTVQPSASVRAVYVFVKIQDADSGTMSTWNSGTAMNPVGGGVFRRTIGTASMPDPGDYSSAYLLYQFAAEGADQQIVGRSPVFGDVVVNRCGIQFFPAPLHPIWNTPTPIIVK